MAKVSGSVVRAAKASGINSERLKLVGAGAAISTGTGLITGSVNNVINHKYIAPKYSREEQYYRKYKMPNGTTVEVHEPNQRASKL